MTDTAQRVKQHPKRWEQTLLDAARTQGGQEAVDVMAECIAQHNERTRARLRDAIGKDYREQLAIARRIVEDAQALALVGVVDGV
jgi:hypothetical protein